MTKPKQSVKSVERNGRVSVGRIFYMHESGTFSMFHKL